MRKDPEGEAIRWLTQAEEEFMGYIVKSLFITTMIRMKLKMLLPRVEKS